MVFNQGLGTNATENWEMCEAIWEKKTSDYAIDYAMERTILYQ